MTVAFGTSIPTSTTVVATSTSSAPPRPDLRERFGLTDLGADLLPSGGQLVQHGQVEIPVDRLGQRPRDRRGGREQEMRIDALLAQRRPLPHAEAVLLVDHRESELLERDAFDDEGVRADDDVERAGLEPREDVPPVGRA